MFLTATIRDDNGASLGVIVLAPKTFRSGKEGWFGQGKIEIDDRRCQAVQIGSKAKSDAGDVEAEA